mmetsp:Transcript_61249/g.126993  ORF Transcript_61249/g.126993 Transcript_61249/m.126993 type:complete len:232 (-) Transcript_61249:30-725(-)
MLSGLFPTRRSTIRPTESLRIGLRRDALWILMYRNQKAGWRSSACGTARHGSLWNGTTRRTGCSSRPSSTTHFIRGHGFLLWWTIHLFVVSGGLGSVETLSTRRKCTPTQTLGRLALTCGRFTRAPFSTTSSFVIPWTSPSRKQQDCRSSSPRRRRPAASGSSGLGIRRLLQLTPSLPKQVFGAWSSNMRDTVRMVSKSKISVNTEWNIVPSTGTASWELEHSIQRKPSRT